MIVSLGHRVVCIIFSNSSIDWLGDTVTGVGGWWSQLPCFLKIYSVILQERYWNDC